MKQQFLEDIAGTFKTYVFDNNRKIVPTSATLTIYKPGSSDKVADGVSMSVAADGLLSYELTTAHNDVAGEDYKAVIIYVYNTVTYPAFNLFYDVVKSKLVKVITDEDIINELPQLKDNGWKVRGTATGGSATTIVDAGLKRCEDDYFTGGIAHNLTTDEVREITDFVSSTGTVTITTATATAAGHKYVLTRSFSKEIQRAFEKIDDNLKRKGKRAHLVLDPYDLREAHIYYSVAEICKGLARDGAGTFWWEMWKDYEKKAEYAFNSMTFKYDATGDGLITGTESDRKMGPIKVRF